MRRHLCGERFGARGRGSLPRFRDGTGPRLRSLRAGARSSLTERFMPHEKRGPCREIAALERRKAFAAARRPEGSWRQAALRSPRFLRPTRAVMMHSSDAQRRGRAISAARNLPVICPCRARG
jgi:hypothetical protein